MDHRPDEQQNYPIQKMNLFLAVALMISVSSVALGGTPPEVTAQLTKDLVFFVKARGNGKYPDEQISQAVVKIVDEAIKRHPSAFEYSAEELQQFKEGRSIYSDEDIRAGYAELKTMADGLPMPVLPEYYHAQFEAGKLSHQQKTIFQKLTLEIISDAKKLKSNRAGTGQPVIRSESNSESRDKPQPESEGHSR